MSDNTRLPIGTLDGDTYASDDIGGVKTQRVKLTLGADGVSDGDVASGNPLPVTADSLPLPSGAATAARQDLQPLATQLPGALVGGRLDVVVGAALPTGSAVLGKVSLVDGVGDSAMDDANNAVRVNLVAGGAGDGAILDGVSSSIKATVLDLTSANPLTTAIVDGSGNQITSFGGGTQYTEDAAAAADPVGNATILVRKDTLAAITDTDGDNIAARGTNKGELYVKHVDALTVTGVSTLAEQQTQTTALQLIDDTVHAPNDALSKVAAIGAQMDDAGTVAATEGNVSALRVDTNRALHVQLRSGAAEVGTSGAPLRINPTGTTSQPVSNVTASNLNAQVVGNVAHDSPVSGNPLTIAARAQATTPTAVDTDGDVVRLWSSASGALNIIPRTVTHNSLSGTSSPTDATDPSTGALKCEAYGLLFNGTNWDRVRGDITNGLDVDVTRVGGGSVAHDGVGTGVSPLLEGGYASAAAPADVNADGDAVRAWNLRNGARATVLTAAGALIGGDAANGLDVDVTRVGGNVTVVQATPASLQAQVAGPDANDAAITGNPLLMGAKASAAAPADVSADNDAVRVWALRNGSPVVNLAAGGALITGTAADGLDVDAGVVAHDAADAGNPVKMGGKALTNSSVQAAVSATGDRVNAWFDMNGAQVVKLRHDVSYSAAYRLIDSTAGQLSLTFTFGANTNKQLATIYHTGASTKIVRIRKISLLVSTGAAGVFNFEVRALSAATAPATGNPAITPRTHDPADGAAEAACLALPTTAGSLVGADTGTVGLPFEWNSAAAAAIANPSGLNGQEIVLFVADSARGIKPLIMRAANAEGYAINGRCTTAVALRYMALIEFTEE